MINITFPDGAVLVSPNLALQPNFDIAQSIQQLSG